MRSVYKQFIAGVRAELPILIGVIPFGMIYGVLALESGLTRLQSQAMSAIVFAGSSQIVAVQLVGLGTPGIVMVLTIAVVNLRHALYSASLAPYFYELSPAWKYLLSYLLTDEAYAVSIVNYQKMDAKLVRGEDDQVECLQGALSIKAHRHWFFLGAGLVLWFSWQLSTAVGITLGAIIPDNWSLDFTLALTFIALVVPNLKDHPTIGSALTAGIASILFHAVPYKLGLLIAALVGICTGLIMERRR